MVKNELMEGNRATWPDCLSLPRTKPSEIKFDRSKDCATSCPRQKRLKETSPLDIFSISSPMINVFCRPKLISLLKYCEVARYFL